MPSTSLSRSHTMKVMTVCGPSRAKLATQPLKKPLGPSLRRMSAAAAMPPLYLLPPARRNGEGNGGGVKRLGQNVRCSRHASPVLVVTPCYLTLLPPHYSLTKTTVLTTSMGLVAVVAMSPASVLLVRCVRRQSPQPLCRNTTTLISSYVAHWQAVTRAARDMPVHWRERGYA